MQAGASAGSEWLIHPDWRLTTVRDLVDDPAGVLTELGIVMDVCRSDNGLRLLGLNPFSGADLYGCDRRTGGVREQRSVD